MKFQVTIKNVQHVQQLALGLDLAENKLTCVVGKNGVGKTTLIRSIRNIYQSDTFLRTASRGIFNAESSITYEIGEETIQFTYDSNIDSLNCKSSISKDITTLCAVELPMPHGDRFNFFQTVSNADKDIRRQIILNEYTQPYELIEFLSEIYSSRKFQSLVEIRVRGRSYYSILLDDGKYIREDYLSSGEYFLINLYRTIRGNARLIVVDEIDLSLDAAAQVHLLKKLRIFCTQYNCNVLFTTHSLAMMRTLSTSELLYMDRHESGIELSPVSYSYIKTLLFGFTGWDRYILTEDKVLQEFLEAIIKRNCKKIFFQYKIIYIGGGSQVSDLLRRNEDEHFLSDANNVIAVLDGDRRRFAYAKHRNIHFLPIENVEEAISCHYNESDFPYKLAPEKRFNGAKDLFNSLQRDHVMSITQIHSYLCERHESALATLVATLSDFLSQ